MLFDRIGLGTTDPQADFHLVGNSIVQGNVTIGLNSVAVNPLRVASSGNTPTVYVTQDGTNGIYAAKFEATTSAAHGVHIKTAANNGSIHGLLIETPVASIVVSSNGRIGVGTNAPAENIHVVGNAKITGSLSAGSLTLASVTISNISTSTITSDTVVTNVLSTGTLIATNISIPVFSTSTISAGNISAGKINVGGSQITSTNTSYTVLGTDSSDTAQNTKIVLHGINEPVLGKSGSIELIAAASASGGDISFMFQPSVGSAVTNMVIGKDGRVGIGTNVVSTGTRLAILGDTVISGAFTVSGATILRSTLSVGNVFGGNLSVGNITGSTIRSTNLSVSGAISSATIRTANLSVSGTIRANNISASGAISAATIYGNNISVSGSVSAAAVYATNIQAKLSENISVLDFGASPSATPSQNRQAIQDALDYAENKYRVYLPGGIYIVDDTIRIPSNTYFYGDGRKSVIKMVSTEGRDTTVVLTGSRNSPREHIVIENMTIDFNQSRWSVSGGSRIADSLYGGFQDNNACALSICYSEHVLVKGVYCIDGYKHSMDICAPKYLESINGATYDSQPSRFIWVEDCYFTGGGDDNFTTHFSSDIWITNCLSENPSGVRTPTNSNCYEIDDGTRNVIISNCVGIGGICGLQIKGHNYAPAPYNVIVNGLRVANNTVGVEIRHTGWYGNSVSFSGNGSTVFILPAGYTSGSTVFVNGVQKTNIVDYTIVGTTLTFAVAPPIGTNNIIVYKEDDGESPQTVDEDGNPIAYTGVSPTARNVFLSNIEIIAPRSVTFNAVVYPASYGMRIRSYENIQINNVRISDGVLDLGQDYDSTTTLSSDSVCRFYSGVGNLTIKNLSIYGFGTTTYGYYMSSSAIGPFHLDGFVSINGPENAIRISSADALFQGLIQNYSITGNHSTDFAIFCTNPNIQIGQGFASGYRTAVSGQLGSSALGLPAPITYSRTARSSSNSLTTPWPIMQFNWSEGSQDLGAGEGIKMSWGAKLIGDSSPVEFGYIGFEKSNTTDTNRSSNFIVGNSSDGGTTSPTNYLVVEAAGPTRPGTDNNKTLGTASYRWSEIYAGNGTINTSDARDKQQIRMLDEAEKAVALRCKTLMRAFKFNDAVERKGDSNARIHFGVIAQELADAFRSEGLDPNQYSMFCYDQWGDVQEDGTLLVMGDRYGVRYEQLLAFIISVI